MGLMQAKPLLWHLLGWVSMQNLAMMRCASRGWYVGMSEALRNCMIDWHSDATFAQALVMHSDAQETLRARDLWPLLSFSDFQADLTKLMRDQVTYDTWGCRVAAWFRSHCGNCGESMQPDDELGTFSRNKHWDLSILCDDCASNKFENVSGVINKHVPDSVAFSYDLFAVPNCCSQEYAHVDFLMWNQDATDLRKRYEDQAAVRLVQDSAYAERQAIVKETREAEAKVKAAAKAKEDKAKARKAAEKKRREAQKAKAEADAKELVRLREKTAALQAELQWFKSGGSGPNPAEQSSKKAMAVDLAGDDSELDGDVEMV